MCKNKQLTHKYIQVKVNGNSHQNINMKNADVGIAAMWM
jgi:hypothetical protein